MPEIYELSNEPKIIRRLSPAEKEKQKKRDQKLVKCAFRCLQPTGGSISFWFKKYDTDKLTQYTIKDGEVGWWPRMVADHVNENCAIEGHVFVMDEHGTPKEAKGSAKQRALMSPVAFAEDDEPSPKEKMAKKEALAS